MPTIPGVDYAWSHPGGAALKAAGQRFACRYLSSDSSKNLTAAEAADLAAHGISSVVVWETTASRAGAGRAAGIADAKEAVRQATACKMPATRPLYFAVDYDANPAAVVPYFQGVASVIGLARTGVYGGYRVVKYLLDESLVRWAWQTRAWSAGKWDPRAHIRQGATRTIGGVSCDINTAMAADYGQWTPGQTPNVQEDTNDMADITSAQMDQIADRVVAKLTATGPRDVLAGANLYWLLRAINPKIALPTGKSLPPVVGTVAELRPLLAAMGDADPELIEELRQAIADTVVHVDVSGVPAT